MRNSSRRLHSLRADVARGKVEVMTPELGWDRQYYEDPVGDVHDIPHVLYVNMKNQLMLILILLFLVKKGKTIVHSGLQVLKDGWAVGAAVLGVPAKATINEVQTLQFIMQKR
ncbi:Uncharacterized protein Rs2_11293 [Raphanus sativus]|nr:Uncharacterized protein Rs2_11293 [Raphanus sativus]